MIFLTSNDDKFREYSKLLPQFKIQLGDDINEVLGNRTDVIKYKALEAGRDTIVDDTVLVIEDEEIVDIRYRINEFKRITNANASWIISLGYNDGDSIFIYEGIVNGVLTNIRPVDGYGLYPYFIADGETQTMYELNEHATIFRPRLMATDNLKKLNYSHKFKINEIPKWVGLYQD